MFTNIFLFLRKYNLVKRAYCHASRKYSMSMNNKLDKLSTLTHYKDRIIQVTDLNFYQMIRETMKTV